jgi:hypothetical protein
MCSAAAGIENSLEIAQNISRKKVDGVKPSTFFI